MHATMIKTCLFGGTLLGAGLAGGASADPILEFGLSTAYVKAYDVDTGQTDWDFFNSWGYFMISAQQGDQRASVEAAPEHLELLSTSFGDGGAYALTVASNFSVTESHTFEFSWDFSGNARFAAGAFRIENSATDEVLIVVDFTDVVSGVYALPLEVGVPYRATGYAFATDSGGTSFVRLMIPAPAGAMLLAAGGGWACVRRRR